MRKYKEWVYKKSEQQRRKNKMKIERLIDINELFQVYMGLNREKEIIRMEFWTLLSLETIYDNSKPFTYQDKRYFLVKHYELLMKKDECSFSKISKTLTKRR